VLSFSAPMIFSIARLVKPNALIGVKKI